MFCDSRMIINFILITFSLHAALSYTNKKFTVMEQDAYSDFVCKANSETFQQKINNLEGWRPTKFESLNYTFPTVKTSVAVYKDPVVDFERIIHEVLYGQIAAIPPSKNLTEEQFLIDDANILAHMPTGGVMRASTFHNKSGVHLPFAEYIHRDNAYLNITQDYMQTAVDAFSIFLSGSINDIIRLPSYYVLNSARTIAMMRIAREKLAVTWLVVKGSTPTDQIGYETLEKFRPLFKYVNGKEMARLNLTDNKILSYIGTHPDLNRHQVGIIASRYLQVNPNWTQVKYLNMMNNLLCGVPIILIRQIPKNNYLQLTHQLFHHIRACDPLQRKLYLQTMMRTQALGKSYSWNTRDVSRLGLLLTELDGPSLGVINPKAMAGITSKVMLEMPIKTLCYVTEMQQRHLKPKSLNIMSKKLNAHYNQMYINCGCARLVYVMIDLYVLTLYNNIF